MFSLPTIKSVENENKSLNWNTIALYILSLKKIYCVISIADHKQTSQNSNYQLYILEILFHNLKQQYTTYICKICSSNSLPFFMHFDLAQDLINTHFRANIINKSYLYFPRFFIKQPLLLEMQFFVQFHNFLNNYLLYSYFFEINLCFHRYNKHESKFQKHQQQSIL